MTDHRVVLAVVLMLGILCLVLSVGELLLVRDIIRQGKGSGSVDPAAAAALAGISTLAGSAVTALAAMLTSTRSGRSSGEVSVPVSVTATPTGSDPAPPDPVA